MRSLTPAQTIVLAFAAAIAIGTILLSLPIAHAAGTRVGVLDAFFTATSAVCVTGLIVVDTGGAFSRFGEVVIMLLIKAGGLGILSLGVLLALASGRRLGFRERQNIQLQTNRPSVGGVVRFTRNLIFFTLAMEAAGTLLLYTRFHGAEGPAEGLFYALFHSVSAFNNAGFALYADSLSGYVGDVVVSLVVPLLFIVGGLGMPLLIEVVSHVRSSSRTVFQLHTKTAAMMTVVLLVVGTGAFLVMEWSNPATLGGLGTGERFLAAFFQAATPRTAGFNTLDFSLMHTGTLVFVVLLMFVGGNPGGTAGGIKTTTFAVLIGSVWMYARGKGALVMFERRIESELIMKAGVIATLGVMLCGGVLGLLSFTDPGLPFRALLFEVVSAMGTVGLSLGITSELSSPGKVAIALLMFAGRVGLLTFALALAEQGGVQRIQHPSEDLIVG